MCFNELGCDCGGMVILVFVCCSGLQLDIRCLVLVWQGNGMLFVSMYIQGANMGFLFGWFVLNIVGIG
jgi:hypothetical protein